MVSNLKTPCLVSLFIVHQCIAIPKDMPPGYGLARAYIPRFCTHSDICCQKEFGPWFLDVHPEFRVFGLAEDASDDEKYQHIPVESLKADIVLSKQPKGPRCRYSCQDTRLSMIIIREEINLEATRIYPDQVRERPVLYPGDLALADIQFVVCWYKLRLT